MPATLLHIDSVYVPPGEFDYEGGIEAQLHGIQLGIRVLPEGGSWDVWTPCRRVAVTLYLRIQGPLSKGEAYVPARLQRLSRWLYHVEGTMLGLEPGQTPQLAGFPEIEIDTDIVVGSRAILKERGGLSFVAELWGGVAEDRAP